MSQEFYKRQELLLNDKQENLKNKKIALIGAGGLGCSFIYSLASFGIEEIFVIDFDTVSLSNIQRQIVFDFDDLDKNKVDCFTKLQKRSFTKITPCVMSASDFFEKNIKVDLVVDATDNINTRDEISKYAKKFNIPWLYTSVEEFYANAALIKDKGLIFQNDKTRIKPQCTPMVMLSASFASLIALKYLAGLDVKLDYLYYFDFSNEIFNLNRFKL